MAYSLKISAKISDDKNVRIEPRWWEIAELRNVYKFEEVWENGCYMDYILNVDKQTFIDIVNSQEKYRCQGIFTWEGWIKINNKTKAEIYDIIDKLPDNEFVNITIFEWESGY